MSNFDALQTVLGLVSVAGIGGIWFRLGSITATHEQFEARLTRLEMQIFQKLGDAR